MTPTVAGTSAPVHALFENFEIWIFEFQKKSQIYSGNYSNFYNSKKIDIK